MGKTLSNQRGQVAILFALVFTFLFVIFGFVVDFGHLINNKINLQLAADAAAYSGAAWQANTLNRISQTNYRIRQDLKEFGMRALVTHIRHNIDFPRGSGYINGEPQLSQTELIMCQQAHGYRSLSGRRYQNDTNLCRNASARAGGLPPIIVPPVIANFDPLAKALQQQIRRIADEANAECRAAANDNKILAQHLINLYSRRTAFHADQIAQITTWLNEVGSGNGTLRPDDNHPIRRVAYNSAFNNLTLANKDGFQIEIIQPDGNEYLRTERHSLNGSLFYINFQQVGDGCVGRPGALDFQMDAGVSKTQEIVTYFAVKAKSQPKMLFMPQRWYDAAFPTLEAVAVAKPFGGRIGPNPTIDNLLPTANRPGNNNRLLNFSFIPDDKLGLLNTRIMALFDALHPFNSASRPDGNQNSGWPDAGKDVGRLALSLVQAPTIFDSIFYSIHPNPNDPNQYLEPQYAESLYPDYLEAADPTGQIIQTREPTTAAYFPMAGNRGQGWIKIDASDSSPGGPYGSYADEGPDSHSLLQADSLGIPYVTEGTAAQFGFATKQMVHSGWAPVQEVRDQRGRIGYSVKLVGVDTLFKTTVKSSNGGAGRIANLPVGLDYLRSIYH